MAEAVAERAVPGFPIPWFEVPGWQDRFGVVAGVTGRGDDPPFDLGLAGADPIGVVLDRWRRVRAAFPGFSGLVIARQVHGSTVLRHPAGSGFAIHEGADGHATAATGLLLAVSLADCIPIYLVDPVHRAVALLHSGWRGTAANILAAGLEALAGFGTRPGDVSAHIGVGICGACYQVGRDVASACGAPAAGDQTQLDLRAVIRGQAEAAGIPEVTVSGCCSAHQRDRFMSHRGSAGADGRMVALLGFPVP
ncbi:MAG: polyphenol oxidase family protein [Gemmatimonadales bacterium]